MVNHVLAGMTVGACVCAHLAAQQSVRHRDTVAAVIVGRQQTAQVIIIYGRPSYLQAIGLGDPVPNGQVWTPGSDEVTQLTTTVPLRLGTLRVPPGTYALWTVPTAGTMALIVNRRVGEHDKSYDPIQDVGRTAMTTDTMAMSIDSLTILFKARRSGMDTIGVQFERKKSNRNLDVYSMKFWPGTTWTLTIEWGPFRWSVPVNADKP